MRHQRIAPVALIALMGCMLGPTTRTFAPAHGPKGIEADLRFKVGRLAGEVLEVQDSALVLLSTNRVVRVPIEAIVIGRFSRRGTLIQEGHVDRGTLASLKLVSRFPAGMTPEIRTRLLAVYGQTEPDVLR
jgi:hypothetical protein